MGVRIEIHKADDENNIITLLEPLEVIWLQYRITVPAGFKSDGASVPEFLWDDVSPAIDPRTIRAAIIHDFIYRTHPEGWTRKMADDLFYDLCRADGLCLYKAQKAYWGVRMFGGYAWNESYARYREGKENAQC